MSVQINDIYYSSWGYDQTNISYYQVMKVTAKSAVLRQIESERTHCESSYGSRVTPCLNKFAKHYPESLLKRIKDNGEYFKMSSYEYARKWDGQPKTETYTG